MADTTKARKLAAGKKKFKEYQQKSRKPAKETLGDVDQAAVDNYSVTQSISTHSLTNINNGSLTDCSSFTRDSPLHEYFTRSEGSHSNDVNFFDNLSQTTCLQYASHNNNFPSTVDKSSNSSQMCHKVDTVETDGSSGLTSDIKNYFSEPVKIQNLEVAQIANLQQKSDSNYVGVSVQDARKLTEYMEAQANEDVNFIVETSGIKEKSQTNQISPEVESAISLNIDEHKNESGFNNQLPLGITDITHSNTESLRQLSSQINQLIDEDSMDNVSRPTSLLEKRNQELAASLENERIESEKCRSQLLECHRRIAQLELESQETKTDYEQKFNRELGPLQEQLQYHAQTVGILVGDKTELSTALSQSQLLAKQKVTECEELQARLKASRSRAVDLEKELNSLKLEKTKADKVCVEEDELKLLKTKLQNFVEQKEEVDQDMLELREKLNIKVSENVNLQHKIEELQHQLSLAQIKIQQITVGDSLLVESHLETLSQQKLDLEKTVVELRQAVKAANSEREQSCNQYQQYVQQLNSQITSLATKLDDFTQENESLIKREQSLVKHIGELEKHLQNIQDEKLTTTTSRSNGELKKELDVSLEALHGLQSRHDTLSDVNRQLTNKNESLLNELTVKNESILSLESTIRQLQGDQPDSSKLLAAMESDKVAAARAVAQNAQLKQELEEIQQAFIRMTNDKAELTDQLTSEQYRYKEISDKVNQLETQLQTLSEAIAIKDKELLCERNNTAELSKKLLQQVQLEDRLRHYEAQDNGSHVLQHELQEAHKLVHSLSVDNERLKLIQCGLNSSANKQDLNMSEIDQLHEELDYLKKKNGELERQLSHNNFSPGYNSSTEVIENEMTLNSSIGSDRADVILDKEVAMKRLEEKYRQTMEDIANLTEEKQRLEHLVLQLQGETDTIGEYIALYQHQRGILKQRTYEKDEQLKQLEYDRNLVKNKLEQLNTLVKKLIQEKGALTSEILEQHEYLNQESGDLCAEHAMIHKEINKIALENVNTGLTVEQQQLGDNNNGTSTTAQQIIALLSDIKTSNLVQPSEGLENFHPCPWCSGQLMTV